MTVKYRLSEKTCTYKGKTLYRIECVTPFSGVKEGELGGWVESLDNLSQYGNSWVYDNAMVYDNARVYGKSNILGKSVISGHSVVFGETVVSKSPLVISGSLYDVLIADNVVIIGCQCKTVAEWGSLDFGDIVNLSYISSAELWMQMKSAVLSMAKAHQSNTKG